MQKKMLVVSAEAHSAVKKYCKDNNLIMTPYISQVLCNIESVAKLLKKNPQ